MSAESLTETCLEKCGLWWLYSAISVVVWAASSTFWLSFFAVTSAVRCRLLWSAESTRFTSSAEPWAELSTAADQSSGCNLPMQDHTRQVLRASWWHVQATAAGPVKLWLRLNSYGVVELVIPSISCIQATVCGITLNFYNIGQCGDADSLIDGNLGAEMEIFL